MVSEYRFYTRFNSTTYNVSIFFLSLQLHSCYLELANYEKSYKYGKESYEAAIEAEDEVWQLNTSVLLAQSQGNCPI